MILDNYKNNWNVDGTVHGTLIKNHYITINCVLMIFILNLYKNYFDFY